ncbi:hypothetical protein [Bacteroides sp.]|uniref:hypothetical protein n=1 Tax=Bacteroides sp. TaxID=29523 RepID=UPI002624A015|nr:hypothetical protein [Bacteroides sp.]MDD3041014.1 hypothetical protein [Bacteroides sp.]
MLRRANFRIDFSAYQRYGKDVKMSEEMSLPYRTEETHMHCSSTVFRAAKNEIETLLDVRVEIKHIYLLTDFEEINE